MSGKGWPKKVRTLLYVLQLVTL